MFQSQLLWQNDPRWANDPLGFGPPTIKEWGCLMTSLTMVVNGFSYQETPQTFNEKMKAGDGFSGALIRPAVVPGLFPRVQIPGRDDCENAPAPIATIDAALASGMPVIVQVDWSPEPGAQSHWVVAYARQGNDYLILDPYQYPGDAPGKPLLLMSRYHFSGPTLAQAITSVIYIAGAQSAGGTVTPSNQPKARLPVPQSALTLYTSEDQLALRADHAVSGVLITRLAAGTALTVLEAHDAALSKVGQYNQWLQVQDPPGDQGFAAAWYIAASPVGSTTPGNNPGSTTPSGSSPTPAGGDLTLVPTGDGLALRDQPDVAANLIKRLSITSQLKALDPAGEAAKKLGTAGQWIRVRDITGTEGYVAAWYVTAADNPALGVKAPADAAPTAAPNPPSSDLIVRTTADQVALRSAPVVSDDTLLKRLPLRAELLVLEPDGAAKIGVQNQWLPVKDLDGTQGYVAAWYVSR